MIKVAFCRYGVGLRVTHVAFPRRAVLRRDFHSLNFLKERPDEIQCMAIAVAGIVYLAGNTGRGGGLYHEVRDVVDIGEIAALFAVTVNDRLLPVEQRGHEKRQDAGIRTRRILPWTVDVEEAQCDRF